MRAMSIEFAGIELAPAALRHTMLESCVIGDGARLARSTLASCMSWLGANMGFWRCNEGPAEKFPA